jgi:HlyD family secretion protein
MTVHISFFRSVRAGLESYILALVKRMSVERAQAGRTVRWVAAAVVIVVVFFTARYLLRERLPVRAAQAQHQQLVNTVSTNGRVEPEVNYQFYSPIATTVKAVYVHPGDVVPAGKLLVVLDDLQARARVASAESGVKAAQAALYAATHNGTQEQNQTAEAEVTQDRLARDQAQHNLAALTRLASTGAASQGEVIAAQEQLETAQASLNAAQQNAHSRYSGAEVGRAQAALAEAQANLTAVQQVESQTSIRAPIAGTVYSLDAVPTEYADAGKLLLQMANLKQEWVRAYFDEPDMGRLAVGQKILIRWDARPNDQWRGHIERLPVTVITYGTRTVGEVLVTIDDPDTGLLPDTNVTVTATTSSQSDALSIPREALHTQNGSYYVYKIVNGKLRRTPVTIGSPNLTQAPILSGLQQGDWVATETTNGQPLQEDLPIKVQR